MTQLFSVIPDTESLKDSRTRINNIAETLASNFAGTAFPTANLYVGMSCYRTDTGKLYVLKDLTPTWVMVFDGKTIVDGWGKISDLASSGTDLNTLTTSGWHHQPATAGATAGLNYPVAMAGLLQVFASGSMVYQFYTQYNTTTPHTYVRTYYSGTWGAWTRLLTVLDEGAGKGLDADTLDGYQSGNTSGSIPISNGTVNTNLNADMVDGIHGSAIFIQGADIGNAVDLNNMVTTGWYHQNTDAQAAAGTNYPAASAGVLQVYVDGSMVYQTYQTYGGTGNGQQLFFRSKYNTTWYPWTKVWSDANDGAGSGLDADLLDGQHGSYYAPKVSPDFTGIPTVPTAAGGTNNTQAASTAFVDRASNQHLSKSVAGGVQVTLTADEASYASISLTGALTANINVVVPDVAGKWVIRNATTGAFTITVKTAAGAGVLVDQGKSRLLICDGAGVYEGSSAINQVGAGLTQVGNKVSLTSLHAGLSSSNVAGITVNTMGQVTSLSSNCNCNCRC